MIYNEKQLNDINFLEQVKEKAEEFILYDYFREAYDLSKGLEQSIDKIKGFRDKNNEIYKAYKNIIIKLKWVGLPIIVENRIVDLFQNHFFYTYRIYDYDVWHKLKTVLLSIVVFEDRDKLKNSIRQALLKNNEFLTKKKLIIDKQEVNATIGNWLKDYYSSLGTGKINKLKRTQYLINSENVKNLSKEEKNRLTALLDLYERLKLSSLTIEGLEEDIPVDEDMKKGIIKQGIFEPFRETKEEKRISDIISGKYTKNQAEKNEEIKEEISKLEIMASNYKNGGLEQRAIEDEINKKKKILQLEKVRDQFPANSLESKVVEEEMEMLEKK